jgi:hypothetical protein
MDEITSKTQFILPVFYRICKNCGKAFETNSYNKIFCCLDCRYEYHGEYQFRKSSPLIDIACEYCHKIFRQKSKTHRFCSKECYAALHPYKRKFDKLKDRNCRFCGNLYLPLSPGQLYCSYDCYKKGQNEKKHPRMSREITCRICNKTFVVQGRYQIYCSKECQRKRKKDIPPWKQSPPAIVCEICEKKFTPVSRTQIICSKSCLNDFLEKDKIRMRVDKVFCSFCGYYFDVNGKYKPFCSSECFEEYNKITHPEIVPLPKFCLNCKKSQVVLRLREHCNDKNCDTYKAEAKRKKIINDPKKKLLMGSCHYCNEPFHVIYPYQKFCSVECHMLYKVYFDYFNNVITEEI